MAHNSSPGNVARTWTDNQTARHHKWTVVFWLTLLLLVASAWFIITRWPRAAVRTFVATVSVPDYGLRLPTPHYSQWNIEELQKTLAERTLRPWTSLEGSLATSAGALRTWLKSLPGSLRGQEVAGLDTLVIHIRAHAKVNLAAEDKKELVLLSGETPGEDSRVIEIPFQEVVAQLQALKVQNVIVLADFCDLDFAPQLTRAANPIIDALQELCGTLPETEHQVWIVSAKSHGQSSFVSHLLKRTLLQSASEFALDPRARFLDNATNNRSQISLAEFYDRMVRYADRASASQQTPLLFRVGSSQPSRPASTNNAAQANWNRAQQVTVAHISQELVKAKRQREAQLARDEKENGKAASSESTAPANSSTASTSPNNGTSGGPNATSAAAAEPVALDSTLEFWKLRDELESTTVAWSPAQFAPYIWQQLQRTFADQQFAPQSGSLSTASRNSASLLAEVQSIASAIRGGNATVGELGRAYRDFQNAADIQRAAWEDPTILAKTDVARWMQLRQQYRIYATACVHLPDWITWCYYHPEATADLNELIESIVTARAAIPRSGSAIESDLRTPMNTSRIVAAQQKLLNHVLAQRDKLLATMKQPPVQLTWAEEHLLQQVIEFVPLPLSARQELWLQYQRLSSQNVDQSIKKLDESTEQINRGPIDKVLDMAQHSDVVADWFTTASKCLQLVDAQESPGTPNTLADQLRWGESFAQALRQAKPTSSLPQNERLHQWHMGCLRPLTVPSDIPLPRMLPGIVVPASTSKALVVELANEEPPAFRSQSEMTLKLVVKRKDGADVEDCQIAWNFVEQTARTLSANNLTRDQCLTIRTDSDSPQDLSREFKRVSVANKTLRLTCRTGIDTTQFKEPIGIDLRIQEVPTPGTVASTAESLRIAIRPQQPDVVSLSVNAASTPPLLFVKPSTPILGGTLRALAVKDASSKFEFQLNNLSSDDKRCIVYGHALSANALSPTLLSSASQPGSRSNFEKEVQSLLLAHPDPHLVSEPVELPAGSWNSVKPVAIALKKYTGANATAAQPSSTPPASSEKIPDDCKWLVFRIQEVDAENKHKNKTAYLSVFELEGLSPAIPEVLSITPANKPTQDGFSLRIEPNRNMWQMFGNSELALRAEITDSAGTPSGTPPISRAFVSDAPGPQIINLQIDPAKLRVDQMLAHLSIGGYPRAVAYHVESNEAKPYPSALAWIVAVEGIASNRSAPVVRSDQRARPSKNGIMAEEWIYPAKDKDGEVNYESLLIQTRVDVPAHARVQLRLIDANNSNEIARGRILERDRQFQFALEPLPTGALSLAATASDLRIMLPAPLDGRMTLQVESLGSSDAVRSVLQRQTLVFDHQPPNPSTIVPSSEVIRGGKPFSLRIKPTDDLSGVSQVIMAIDGAKGQPDVFDPMDEQIVGSPDGPQEWVFPLDVEALIKSQRRMIKIVAMSVDSAGNEQKANVPVVLSIQPAQKASDQSK